MFQSKPLPNPNAN